MNEKIEGQRLLLLAGRSWKAGWIDWKRRRCFVEEAEHGGKARWHAPEIGTASFELTRAREWLAQRPVGRVETAVGEA
ncbi:hypothetical protein [Lentzea sp. NPDC055074]